MSGTLSHSPAEIVAKALIDLGNGTAPSDNDSWPIYHSHLPDTPDDAIGIFDTAGIQQGRTHIDGDIQEKYGITVNVRAATSPDGYVKAKQGISLAFDRSIRRTTVAIAETDYIIHAITRSTDVLSLGVEQGTRRRLWSINAIADIRQTS